MIVLAAITLPLGYTSGKEYAELEWPIDILITLVWVVLRDGVLRHDLPSARSPHIYVANWFFGAFILTVALLHIVNSAEMPVDASGSRTRPTPACRTRWCSGGTATTRSASS